ncbi:MAG: cytochrome c biogenesis protein CcsA [Candidatus Thermoplasmatota archaeon]
MNLAQGLLWGAAGLATVAVALGAAGLRSSTRNAARGLRSVLAMAASLTAVAFVFLLSRFIAADVSYQYVFLYTKTTLALPWRIAGTWAGREGSLLLWAMWLAIVAWAVARHHHRRPPVDGAEERGRAWAMLFLAAFSAALLWAVALQDTFASTPSFFLEGRPGGNGLNPTLKSQFILIHPPLMFLAYALAAVPAAAALGHLASGTDRWSAVATPWARLDWLLYTVAMGLGGLWAYYTLGFGGYWAWDPVEVANLLPWVALTVYLHAQLHHARHGSYKVAGPFLALLPLLLTLFSTISTRSGLWVSVHAFTDPTNTFDPDAPGRFLNILAVESGLLFPVRLFLATLGLGLALWCIRLARDQASMVPASRVIAGILAAYAAYAAVAPASALSLLFEAASRIAGGHTGIGLMAIGFLACLAAAAPALLGKHEPAKPRTGARITLPNLAYYAVLVLSLGLLVLFLFHAAAANGWNGRFYEDRLPFIAAPVLAGLIVMLGHGVHGRKRSVLIASGALVAAGVAAAVWTTHREGAFLLVLSLVAVFVGLDKVRRAALPPGAGKRQWLAPTLLWAAALLDLLFWLNPPSRIGFGAFTWRPVWPAQLVFGAVAGYVLWQSHRILAGAAPRRPAHVHLLAGLLAGFWVAAPLAGAAWLLHRRDGLTPALLDAKAKARLRQAALYGAHLAVVIAFLGYAASTYWKETEVHDVTVGETASVAGHDLVVEQIAIVAEPGTAFAERFDVVLDDDGRQVAAEFGWEEQVGAHFPLPTTLRLWDGDVFANVRSIDVAESACGPARTIAAYQASAPPRACAAGEVTSVQLEVIWLPGLGIVWLALALFAFHMAMLMSLQPARAAATPTPTPEP